MDKKAIRDELKRHEAACAELRAKLEEPKQPEEYKQGEVWKMKMGGIVLFSNEGPRAITLAPVITQTGRICDYDKPESSDTRLGTFDEVFVRRDSLKKDYVSKKEISETLQESYLSKDEYDYDVRCRISDKFDIDY